MLSMRLPLSPFHSSVIRLILKTISSCGLVEMEGNGRQKRTILETFCLLKGMERESSYSTVMCCGWRARANMLGALFLGHPANHSLALMTNSAKTVSPHMGNEDGTKRNSPES